MKKHNNFFHFLFIFLFSNKTEKIIKEMSKKIDKIEQSMIFLVGKQKEKK